MNKTIRNIISGNADIQEQHKNELLKQARIKIDEIDKFYRTPIHFVRMIARNHNNALMFEGEGGLGKTHIILKTLNQESTEYYYMRGYTTPMQFYITLYEHRNMPVIVLDDIEGIFKNDIGKSLIKATLDMNQESRIIQYNSPRLKTFNIPKEFRPNFRVIVCANRYPNDSDFMAVMDRCLYYPFRFTYKQKLEILRHISKLPYKTLSDRERAEIYNHIRAISTKATQLSIRTLFKIYDLYLYDRKEWRTLSHDILKNDDDIVEYLKAIERHQNIKDQIAEFTEHTGKSRATFYRIKKRMKE